MSRLRVALLVYAALALTGAYFIFRAGVALPAALYLAINGIIVGAAVIFERGRYKPEVSSGEGWETTDEKFLDATTGKWMVVRYNRKTGERDYVEQDPTEK